MKAIDRFWYEKIKTALASTFGNVTESAKILGCSRITIYRKAKEFNLDLDFYRARKTKKV